MDERVLHVLGRHLKYAGDSDIDPDRSLRDLGLDSMRAIELLFDLEAELEVEVPDEFLNDETFATARSLCAAVERVRTGMAATGTGVA